MCLNCGCGEPEKRHEPSDITLDDVQDAAKGSGISVGQATTNMRAALDKVGADQMTQEGYAKTR